MWELPGYSVERTLGKGGMATVYLAQQLSLQRPVAIKVLNATLCSEPQVQQQFKQESLLVAQLNHPNIIHVIDQGMIGLVQPYFVMQYIKSIPLTSILTRHDVSMTRKLHIAIQVCKALSYAHRNGVVHRDIKPGNVLVDYDGHVRVVDFGIAGYFEKNREYHPDGQRSQEAVDQPAASHQDDALPDALVGGAAQSRVRLIMGTPAYMAPEQYDPLCRPTALNDIYSLGILLHELFTGQRPVDGQQPVQRLPATLHSLIQQCINKQPTKRPQSVDDVCRVLLLLLQGKHLQPTTHPQHVAQNDIPSQFVLMDVLRQSRYGATYLVNEPNKKQWLVVKKHQIQNQQTQGQALEVSGIGTEGGVSGTGTEGGVSGTGTEGGVSGRVSRTGTEGGASAGASGTGTEGREHQALRTCKKLAKLRHPNIVKIYGTSSNERVFISVMEYVETGSLQERISQAFELEYWLTLAQQLCAGLHFAHTHGVVHGNLRPSNLLVVNRNYIKITDFGYQNHSTDGKQDWYQPIGEPTTVASDIFSVGAVLFNLVTGKIVKQSKTGVGNFRELAKLPAPIQTILKTMLAKDPSQRYKSLDQVSVRLRRYLENTKTVVKEPAAVSVERGVSTQVINRRRRWYDYVIRIAIIAACIVEVLWHF